MWKESKRDSNDSSESDSPPFPPSFSCNEIRFQPNFQDAANPGSVPYGSALKGLIATKLPLFAYQLC